MPNIILQAASFASYAHKGQFRNDGVTPYINHVARVAGKVATLPYANELLVCAAYLHDVLEDCGIADELLGQKFPREIVFLVTELTNWYTKKRCPSLRREQRKKQEAERLAEVSKEAKVIKLIDRMDNLRDIAYPLSSSKDMKWARKYLEESEALFTHIKGCDTALDAEFSQVLDTSKNTFDIYAPLSEEPVPTFDVVQDELIVEELQTLIGEPNVP